MKPRIYVSNQFGFSELLRNHVLNAVIIPRLETIGFEVLEPFGECKKYHDPTYFASIRLYDERAAYLKDFNAKITSTNNALIDSSNCMAAVLDGGHAVDDGTASEIGYYAGRKIGPVFALRSDFRLAENLAAPVNIQIMDYITQSGGLLIDGPGAVEKWFLAIENFYKSM